MKRKFLFVILLLLPLAAMGQDCFRITYLRYLKREVAGSFSVAEMKLDFNGKEAFFYNESSFLKDSLDVLAFDSAGSIVNEEAYAERTRLPAGTNDKSLVDFAGGQMIQHYFDAASFTGSMPLELPQWQFTGEEEEACGRLCRVATGRYLGRDWKIWYTEDVPLNTGPWFLWGTPGLIVAAKDSEYLLVFKLVAIERIDSCRLENERSYRKVLDSRPYRKTFRGDLQEMEKMHSRYRRDSDYFNAMHGIAGGYSVDRHGNRTNPSPSLPYIPMIPDEYWKKK